MNVVTLPGSYFTKGVVDLNFVDGLFVNWLFPCFILMLLWFFFILLGFDLWFGLVLELVVQLQGRSYSGGIRGPLGPLKGGGAVPPRPNVVPIIGGKPPAGSAPGAGETKKPAGGGGGGDSSGDI